MTSPLKLDGIFGPATETAYYNTHGKKEMTSLEYLTEVQPGEARLLTYLAANGIKP
jgi:hypothetical protein